MAGWLMPKSFATSVCLRPCCVISSLASIALIGGRMHFTATSQGVNIYVVSCVIVAERYKYTLLLW
jgi:hypothetical protein